MFKPAFPLSPHTVIYRCRKSLLENHLRWERGSGGEGGQLVIRRRFVAADLPAFLTLVNEHESLLPILIKSNRLHEASTTRGTIPRTLRINMLGMEALEAVIAIRSLPERLHEKSAVCAGERFFARNEHQL